MKKHLLPLVTLAACGTAMAQSSVTLFGVVDAGVARLSASGAAHTTGLVSGGSSTSRLGFRGTEDLGGGLSAGFWLEGQLNNDSGGGATPNGPFDFVRRSTVSLTGSFGEVRLGRDFAPTVLNMIAFDAWGQRGIGTVGNFGPGIAALTAGGSTVSYVRNSNTVAYFLPRTLGGVYGTAQYSFGERSSDVLTTAITSKKQGNYFGGRIGYARGPVDVSASYGRYADVSRAGTYVNEYSIANLGGSYDFGFIKPMALFQTEKVDGRGALPAFKLNTYWLGATAPVGPGLIKLQAVRYDNRTANATGRNDASQYSVGYQYNLSKRTALYADAARVNNKGTANFSISNMSGSLASPVPTGGGKATGYVIGIKHSF